MNMKTGLPTANTTVEEPMKSLKGASMRLNIDSGMAEVIHEDRVTSFGGVPAIKEWVQELGISKDDARRLYELDAQGSRRSELSAEAEEALAGMRKNMPVPASLVFHMPYSVFGSFAASCLVSPAFFMENAGVRRLRDSKRTRPISDLKMWYSWVTNITSNLLLFMMRPSSTTSGTRT